MASHPNNQNLKDTVDPPDPTDFKDSKNLARTIGSRVRSVYIKLHEFSFFHSPYGLKKANRRFIGRTSVSKKLKSILSRSESKSGAYLITGFRGMGKTSLVRKVLSDMSGRTYRTFEVKFKILLLSLILALALTPIGYALVYLIVSFYFIIGLGIQRKTEAGFIYKDRLKNYWDNEQNIYRHSFLINIWKSTGFFLRISSPCILLFTESIIGKWGIFLFIILAFYLFIRSLNQSYFRNRESSVSKLWAKEILLRIGDRIRNRNKLVIEISLAQDDLKEVDVLKILSRNILYHYKKFRNKRDLIPRLGVVLLYIIIAYGIAIIIYYNPRINKDFNQFREKNKLTYYFPSQTYFIYKNDPSKAWNINDAWLESPWKKADSANSLEKYALTHYEALPNELKDLIPHTDYNNVDPKNNTSYYWYIDRLIQDTYAMVFGTKRTHFLEKCDLSLFSIELSDTYTLIPYRLDYAFLAFWSIILTSVVLIGNFIPLTRQMTNRTIIKRLERLNENISAEIIREHSGSISTPILKQVINLFISKKSRQPIAGIREIEMQLIEILRDIDDISILLGRPEFIFIFDELDKIESGLNANLAEKEAGELNRQVGEIDQMDTQELLRQRQNTIFRILSNLKLFFNTALAKFIFVAGREMYDASLADVSDRESFLSSIFHEVIYVDSFYKDPDNLGTTGVTGLTTEYVMQFLFPLDQKRASEKDSLGEYYNYLRAGQINVDEKEHRKIIYTLQRFITYLSYRSNGSPKQITKLFESYVIEIEPDSKNIHEDGIFSDVEDRKSAAGFYLRFGYNDQYILGLTSYLIRPYQITRSRHIREFSDKLLVATSYVMDHLYKFHSFGFSWRHLELTPEIIAINKSPELRKYIQRAVEFLSQNHIEEIISGLYQFRFHNKLHSELRYVSTISDLESAAFNFSLDESRLVKRHYKKKLASLENQYKNTEQNLETHINSIGYLHMIIGDLYYFDKEYDEAILHYMDAIQVLRSLETPTPNQRLLLIRYMLQLGHTFDKMKIYDSAYMFFGKLVELVDEYASDKNRWLSTTIKDPNNEESKIETWIEKQDHFKQGTLESIRVIYQPLIAWLEATEKHVPGGITQADMARVGSIAKNIFNGLNVHEKYLIRSEHFSQAGNLLFFKNGWLEGSIRRKWLKEQVWGTSKEDCKQIWQDFKKSFTGLKDIRFAWETLYDYSMSIRYLLRSLQPNKTVPSGWGEQIYQLSQVFFEENPADKNTLRSVPLIYVGQLLGHIGDLFLTFQQGGYKENNSSGAQKIDPEFYYSMLTAGSYQARALVFKHRYRTSTNINMLEEHSNEIALYCYFFASQLYLRAGNHYNHAMQLRKILYYTKSHLQYIDSGFIKNIINVERSIKNDFIQEIRKHLNFDQNSLLSKLIKMESMSDELLIESHKILLSNNTKNEFIGILIKKPNLVIASTFFIHWLFNQDRKYSNLKLNRRFLSKIEKEVSEYYANKKSTTNIKNITTVLRLFSRSLSKAKEKQQLGNLLEEYIKEHQIMPWLFSNDTYRSNFFPPEAFDLGKAIHSIESNSLLSKIISIPNLERGEIIKAIPRKSTFIRSFINKNGHSIDQLLISYFMKVLPKRASFDNIIYTFETKYNPFNRVSLYKKGYISRTTSRKNIESKQSDSAQVWLEFMKTINPNAAFPNEKKGDDFKREIAIITFQTIKNQQEINIDSLEKYFEIFEKPMSLFKSSPDDEYSRFIDFLFSDEKTFREAIDLLIRCNEFKSKIMDIIYVKSPKSIRYFFQKPATNTEILTAIREYLVRPILATIDKSHEQSRIMELNKALSTFNLNSNETDTQSLPRTIGQESLLSHPEMEETLILFEEIKLLTNKYPNDSALNLKANLLVNPFLIPHNKFSRSFGLRLKVKEHRKWFEENKLLKSNQEQVICCFTDLDSGNWSTDQKWQNIIFVISDAIFCLHEIIKTLRLMGSTYLYNHYFLGEAYLDMGDWCSICLQCEAFASLDQSASDNSLSDAIRNEVRNLVGPHMNYTLDNRYHYRMAREHFYKVLQTHAEGDAYRRMLDNMHVLEDDFNDPHYHFCAAMERFRVNSGYIRNKIELLTELLGGQGAFNLTQSDSTQANQASTYPIDVF